MKLKSLTLILFCLSLCVMTACNNDSAKKSPAIKATSSKTMLPVKNYWVKAKKNLGLNTAQVEGIKKIQAKYNSKTAALKKAKKWDGKANAKTRTNLQTSKTAELKKLLGNKLPLFQKFTTKHGIKVVKKKGKKPTSKKPKPAKKKAVKINAKKKPQPKKKTGVNK